MTRTRVLRLVGALVVAAVAIAIGMVAPLGPLTPTVQLGPKQAPISTAALEQRYGIRLTRIAVTAAGGMVDLRFTVVDAEKAKQVLKAPAAPTLVASDSGLTLHAPQQGSMRSIRLQQNAACFVLFPNVRSAVKAGTRVSLALGGLQVEPVIAL